MVSLYAEQLNGTIKESENAIKQVTSQVKESGEKLNNVADRADKVLSTIEVLIAKYANLPEQLFGFVSSNKIQLIDQLQTHWNTVMCATFNKFCKLKSSMHTLPNKFQVFMAKNYLKVFAGLVILYLHGMFALLCCVLVVYWFRLKQPFSQSAADVQVLKKDGFKKVSEKRTAHKSVVIPLIAPIHIEYQNLDKMTEATTIPTFVQSTLNLVLPKVDLSTRIDAVISVFGMQKVGKSTLLKLLFGVDAKVGVSAAVATTEGATAYFADVWGINFLLIDTEGAVSLDKKSKLLNSIRKSPVYASSSMKVRKQILEVAESHLKAYENRLLGLTIAISDLVICMTPEQLSGQDDFLKKFAELSTKLQLTKRQAALRMIQNFVSVDGYLSEFPSSVIEQLTEAAGTNHSSFFKSLTFQRFPNFKEDTKGRDYFEKELLALTEFIKETAKKQSQVQDMGQIKNSLDMLLSGVNGDNLEFASLLEINKQYCETQGKKAVDSCLNQMFSGFRENIDVITEQGIADRMASSKPMLVDNGCPISVLEDYATELTNQISSKASSYLQCKDVCPGAERCKLNAKFGDTGTHIDTSVKLAVQAPALLAILDIVQLKIAITVMNTVVLKLFAAVPRLDALRYLLAELKHVMEYGDVYATQ
ncbi:hypothetical protein HDV06_005603 [Boothiomyces sp. JEL0866]|nr:hypothetical protein HDV06_005603 [Boothiomyces sp. JEL0866]